MLPIHRLMLALMLIGLSAPFVLADPPADPPHHNIFDFGKPGSPPTTQDNTTPDAPAPAAPTIPASPPADAGASTPASASPAPAAQPQPKPAPIQHAVMLLPIPSPSDLAVATKLVDQTFPLTKAKVATIDRKKQLAVKSQQAAIDENSDPAIKYALFRRSIDFSISADDLDGAVRTIDLLSGSFRVEVPKLKAQAVVAIGQSNDLDRPVFIQQAQSLSDDAIQADEYDLATVSLEIAKSNARHLDDKTLLQTISNQLQRVESMQVAYSTAKKAEDLLASEPTDPGANLRSGRFRCFIKGEWDLGLPRLKLGNDAQLKSLASQELKATPGATAQLALADAWWDDAEKETGLAKQRIQAHAADIYSRAMPDLTGLARARAEKRITDSATQSTGHRTVNLLQVFDPDQDVVTGDWVFKDGVLSCDAKLLPVVQFPYQPPEEYDYRIVFVRKNGNNKVTQVCYAGGHQFEWAIGDSNDILTGLQLLDGKMLHDDNNPAAVKGQGWLKNGRPAVSLLKVRKTGVQGYLDGKLVLDLKTDFHNLTLRGDSHLNFKNALGLNAWDSATEFRTVEVTEISGPGKLLR